MNSLVRCWCGLFLSAICLLPACGNSSSGITVEDVWSLPVQIHKMDGEMARAMGAHEGHGGHHGSSNGVVYLTIRNKGSEADRLLSVLTDVCEVAEIHRTTMEDETMMMKKIESSLEIPAGGTVVLKPRDYHVMLIELTQSLVAGDEIALELYFERAGLIKVASEIRAL